jgi:hypothetical protein
MAKLEQGGVMGGGINRGRQRREELLKAASVRAEERASRTPKQQLALLDKRLGKGKGAQKERARLSKEIEK